MPGFSSLSRVTETRMTGDLQASLQRAMQSIAREGRRISSGRAHASLADDPLATRRIVSMERGVERTQKFQANISLADSRLAATESSLAEMENLIIRGREIALGQINASATDETRANAAVEVSLILDELVTLGNRMFGNRYLFAGNQLSTAPFERVGNYVSYGGDDGFSSVEVARGVFARDSVSGVSAFNALSSEIRGRIDLNPVVTLDTVLSDLNNGRGVEAGSIEIRDGVARRFVDLTGAKTVGDVIDLINDDGFAGAALNAAGTGITISKAGANLSVLNVNGNTAASDLGLQQSGMGVTFTGADLDPIARLTTPLAELAAGTGITAGDFTITNGNLTARIDTTGMQTLEDLVNAIQQSGTAVQAHIAADGRTLELFSTLSGAGFRIDEGSGTTAAELGLVVPSDEVEIERLNGGTGISFSTGNDIRITLGDGSSFDVDLESASTLGDIAALLNGHADNGGSLLAEVVAGEDRLRLTDLSAGAGEPAVAALNGSFVVSGLGILGTGSGGVIEGTDLDPGAHRVNSVFDGMALLAEGLLESDTHTMSRALAAFDAAEQALLDTRAEVGTRIRRLEISTRRTELEILSMQEMISKEGDTDLAQAIIQFTQQQTVLQASLQIASRILQQTLLDFLA